MNGNYEFVKHMAQDKQSAFIQEASVHRLAKQAGRPLREWSRLSLYVRVSVWLRRAGASATLRAAGQVASWRALLRGPGPAAQ